MELDYQELFFLNQLLILHIKPVGRHDKQSWGDRMDKIRIITILVGVTLILSLANLYATFNLYDKLEVREELNPAAEPQPTATPQPIKNQVSADDDPVKGSDGASVTIIEFSDFECSFCSRFYLQTLPQIEENYLQTGMVKFVYRDFPLAFHPHAQKAAEASECAQEQDKYWEYHDKLYNNLNALDNESLKQYAKDLGLDVTAFNECLDSGKMASEVENDFQDGKRYGITGTPTFFINGIKVVGARPYEVFEQMIEQELDKI